MSRAMQEKNDVSKGSDKSLSTDPHFRLRPFRWKPNFLFIHRRQADVTWFSSAGYYPTELFSCSRFDLFSVPTLSVGGDVAVVLHWMAVFFRSFIRLTAKKWPIFLKGTGGWGGGGCGRAPASGLAHCHRLMNEWTRRFPFQCHFCGPILIH